MRLTPVHDAFKKDRLVYVNLASIVALEKRDYGSILVMSSGDMLHVRETTEQILSWTNPESKLTAGH